MYEIEQGIPRPDAKERVKGGGFSGKLRRMCKDDSLLVPVSKKGSVHPAAKSAGVKVAMRDLGDGTARVWRLDGPERGEGIFYESQKSIFG